MELLKLISLLNNASGVFKDVQVFVFMYVRQAALEELRNNDLHMLCVFVGLF